MGRCFSLNGLMSFLILISAIYPLVETQRDSGRRLFNQLGKNAYIDQVILSESSPVSLKKMPIIAQQAYANIQIDSANNFKQILAHSPNKTMVIFKQTEFDSSLLQQYPNMITVSGWNDHFQREYWSAISK